MSRAPLEPGHHHPGQRRHYRGHVLAADRAEPAGLPALNLLVLAYLLPAAAASRLARDLSRDIARPERPEAGVLRRAAAAVAMAGLPAYGTFALSQAFQGPVLSLARVTQAELWSYTAIRLLFGAAFLAHGLRRRARAMRVAGLAILAAAAAEVALLDLADLAGAARAASVLALGLVLLGVGMAYQRLPARDADP